MVRYIQNINTYHNFTEVEFKDFESTFVDILKSKTLGHKSNLVRCLLHVNLTACLELVYIYFLLKYLLIKTHLKSLTKMVAFLAQ